MPIVSFPTVPTKYKCSSPGAGRKIMEAVCEIRSLDARLITTRTNSAMTSYRKSSVERMPVACNQQLLTIRLMTLFDISLF
jgi:hypothetical protein